MESTKTFKALNEDQLKALMARTATRIALSPAGAEPMVLDVVGAAEEHVLEHPEETKKITLNMIGFYEVLTNRAYPGEMNFRAVCEAVREAIRKAMPR